MKNLLLTVSFVSCSPQTVVPKRIGAPHPVVHVSEVSLKARSESLPLNVAQATLKVDQPFTVHGTIAGDEENPRDGWLKIAVYANDDGSNKQSLGSILISLADNRKHFDAPLELGIIRSGKHRLCAEFVGLDGTSRIVGNGDLVIGSK